MPALGGAQRVAAEEAFGQAVKLLVVGHDQVRVARDDESRDVHVAFDEFVQLRQQHGRVDDDAIADHRRHAGIENARRDELEGELLTVDHDAVAGVVAALITNDHVHVARQKSVSFPLPSSPHWVPTTTVAGTGLPRDGLVATQSLPERKCRFGRSMKRENTVDDVDVMVSPSLKVPCKTARANGSSRRR